MLVNFCIIGILALVASAFFEKLKLPGLLGMLLVGVVIGPNMYNLIHPTILEVSKELRDFALIVILLRAGLGLHKEELHKVGKSAIKLSFIPGIMEAIAVLLFAHYILDFSIYEAGILGFIIAAVSPAVVVPQMLALKEQGIGKKNEIPTLVLAGASVDDIVAITFFTTFLSLYFHDATNVFLNILEIPVSIVTGIVTGIILAVILSSIFKKFHIRDTKKIIILLAVAIFFNYIEKEGIPNLWINSLLGIMTIGFILVEYSPKVANRLSVKMNKVWVFAEILLFVLIGATVNVEVAIDAGVVGLLLLTIGLTFRSIGVLISLIGSELSMKERWFCVLAYIPKATVQAAIGAIPLSLGVVHGEEILAFAVLAIVITAPLGSMAIRISSKKLLEQNI